MTLYNCDYCNLTYNTNRQEDKEMMAHCKSKNHVLNEILEEGVYEELKITWGILKKNSGASKDEKEKAKARINELEKQLGKKETEWQDEQDTSQTKELYEFALAKAEKLIVSDDDSNQVYAKIHNKNHIQTINLDSSNAVSWLEFNHRHSTGKFYSPEYTKNAIKQLKGEALFNGSITEKIFIRLAQTKDSIYYDLGRRNWELVKITPSNYIIIPYSTSTPTFDRTRGITEQVAPKAYEKGKNPLDDLCNLLRIKEKLLFKVHLIHFFLQNQETPIMVITGEYGSVKTTITQSIKKIVDPSSSNIGSLPIDKKELQIDISNKYLSLYDNVSGFKHYVSDILCRAITGDEIAKRALYTNNDMFVRAYEKKKLILNGISPNIEFPDFNDRSIYYETSYLPNSEKMSKSDYWKEFDKLLPYVLHQVFMALSKMLSTHAEIGSKIRTETRLGDFEQYGETISQALGYEPQKFIETYRKKLDEIGIKDVDSWPVIRLVMRFMNDKDNYKKEYENRTPLFYKEITELANIEGIDTKAKGNNWPKKVNHFSSQLNQLKKQFRTFGLEISIGPYHKRDKEEWHNRSVIKIVNSSLPPQPPQPLANQEQNNHEQKTIGKDGKDGKDGFVTLKCSICPNFQTTRPYSRIKEAEMSHRENMKDNSHILEIIKHQNTL